MSAIVRRRAAPPGGVIFPPMRSAPALSLLALTLAVSGCGPGATAQQVRKTADGGTILVGGGSGAPQAMRQAVASIEQHCRGVYEVVELAQVQTGQTTSTGVAYSIGPISLGTSSSAPVYGTTVTYLCRPPQSTVLNESIVEMASADLVGQKCRVDNDCGPLLCARSAPSAETGVCAPSGR
jgi:hypothetical protein